jgi:hypothetical protein
MATDGTKHIAGIRNRIPENRQQIKCIMTNERRRSMTNNVKRTKEMDFRNKRKTGTKKLQI